MTTGDSIPVIDIFAGPGGLGEGFTGLAAARTRPTFRIALSVEKDSHAYRTLELRALFRALRTSGKAGDYYKYLLGAEFDRGIDRDTLFRRHPAAAKAARREAWHYELAPHNRADVSAKIKAALGKRRKTKPWVLLGGPPCQAYSIAGRSRLRTVLGDEFDGDHRHTLYQEYLAIIDEHAPPLFIMENVKGLLSSQLRSRGMFDTMLRDLKDASGKNSYVLFSFVHAPPRSRSGGLFPECATDYGPTDFLIESEDFGIPQARHRVIILGVRADLLKRTPSFRLPLLAPHAASIPVSSVLEGLPRLRSGLTEQEDSSAAWSEALAWAGSARWLHQVNGKRSHQLVERIQRVAEEVRFPRAGRGGRFVPSSRVRVAYKPTWYLDARIGGVCNHESRPHMESDLHRYLFASCFAAVYGHTPKLGLWPKGLLPNHANVHQALHYGMFNDRFRVQIRGKPATTITCHLAKDGHYNIHYDPSQCRSLTVREAARIQTFPDNYFFEGPRTQQYVQVGNAVPPLLARQLARIVSKVIAQLV